MKSIDQLAEEAALKCYGFEGTLSPAGRAIALGYTEPDVLVKKGKYVEGWKDHIKAAITAALDEHPDKKRMDKLEATDVAITHQGYGDYNHYAGKPKHYAPGNTGFPPLREVIDKELP